LQLINEHRSKCVVQITHGEQWTGTVVTCHRVHWRHQWRPDIDDTRSV